MRGIHHVALPSALLLAGMLTAAAADLTPQVDGQVALDEVRAFVALGARVSGTPGAQAAANYLAKRLAALGLNPQVDVFEAPTRGGAVTFRNVTATCPGTRTNELVVLISHYDTKAGIAADFAGANDSGSSTGLLLALAPHLNKQQLPFSVMLAFVDGEECVKQYSARDGLHGSRRLLERLAGPGQALRVRAAIVLDMVGDRDLTITIPRNSTTALIQAAFAAAEALNVRQHFRLYGTAILDDHVPFFEAGIPAIDLIDFEFGSSPGRNNYWHTTADTIDKLSPDSLAIVGRVVLKMLNDLARH